MTAEISIRQATSSDVDAIFSMEKKCFELDGFSRRQFLYLITKAKGMFYVLSVQEKVVAYLSLVSNRRTRNVRIYSIAVHPQVRGQGMGQLLIEKSIQYARDKQMKAVTLEVRTNNLPAIHLYEKNGFVKRLIKINYYLDGSDAFGMYLSLL